MSVLVKSMGSLQEELVTAKENLKGVDENIKKLIGRDPSEQRINLKRGANTTENQKPFNKNSSGRRKEITFNDPPEKKYVKEGVFKRLGGPVFGSHSRDRARMSEQEHHKEPAPIDSGEEEELPNKPTIASSVVASAKEQKSRSEVVAQQGKDKKILDRHRRMFGSLLNTLQKFSQENTKLKDKEEKRLVVEKKIEAAALKEKEELKKERQDLFFERRRKQAEIRRIEYKMARVREQENWEVSQKPLLNFILTNAKPSIFYLPKVSNEVTLQRHEESQKRMMGIVEEKRNKLKEELEEVELRARRFEGEVREGYVSRDEECGPRGKRTMRGVISRVCYNSESQGDKIQGDREDIDTGKSKSSRGHGEDPSRERVGEDDFPNGDALGDDVTNLKEDMQPEANELQGSMPEVGDLPQDGDTSVREVDMLEKVDDEIEFEPMYD